MAIYWEILKYKFLSKMVSLKFSQTIFVYRCCVAIYCYLQNISISRFLSNLQNILLQKFPIHGINVDATTTMSIKWSKAAAIKQVSH